MDPLGSPAVERVWAAVPPGTRSALERDLSPTDLQTLLMSVMRSRAAAVTPARLRQRWRDDRFVRPGAVDPRTLARIELRLWDLLPAQFDGVELSPVAPLGTCSAVAGVDQNRMVATVRGTEVVSDPTNVLALEVARRRRAQQPEQHTDLAACHRVLRAQVFSDAGVFQHFRLFALVSSARDRGAGRTEAELLVSHLGYWARVLSDLLPDADIRIRFTSFGSPVLSERFHDTVQTAVHDLPNRVAVTEDPTRSKGVRYYVGAALRILADAGHGEVEIGDGGLTDWTAQLMNDAKERCLISCIATERLADLVAGQTRT